MLLSKLLTYSMLLISIYLQNLIIFIAFRYDLENIDDIMFTKSSYSSKLILIGAILIFTTRFSSSCLVGCFCEETKITCENVDISTDDLEKIEMKRNVREIYFRRNNLNEISSEILKKLTDIETLEISGNNIEDIPMNTFKDFSNLEKLILTGNELKVLSKDMFTGLDNLYSLDLSENHISELSNNVFEKLLTIVDIRLSQNNLTVIPDFVFSSIKTLRFLFLSNNFIHEIHDQAFQNLSMIKLGLSFNSLKSIPVSAFKGFKISGKIVLINNPLNCSCPFAMKYASNLQHLQGKVWGFCENPVSVRNSNILRSHKNLFCSMCDLQPCLNKGECIRNKTAYICKCGETYKGVHCELDICGNSVRNTSKTTMKDKKKEVLGGETENRSVNNHTEYIYLKEKVADSQTKFMILYTTCTIEFLIILGLVAYIAYKRYKEWKEEKEYNLRITKRILFEEQSETNAKLSKALNDTDSIDYGLRRRIKTFMMTEDTREGEGLTELTTSL